MTVRERTGGQLFELIEDKAMKESKATKESGDSRQGGFTLVELILTLALTVLFLAGAVGIVAQGFTFMSSHQNLATLNRDGNNTLDRLETMMEGCYLIDNANTSTAQFAYSADIDGEDSGSELIVIGQAGSDVTVTVGTGAAAVTSIVLSSLNSPLEFTYYKEWKHEAGDVVTSGYNESVKVVKITLHLTNKTGGKTMNKTYERFVLLKLTPNDRAT